MKSGNLSFVMVKSDKRYAIVKRQIHIGEIKQFKDIITYVPISVIANDLKRTNGRMAELFQNPERVTYKQTFEIAELCQTDALEIAKLIVEQISSNRK